jgi:hypothetical protein
MWFTNWRQAMKEESKRSKRTRGTGNLPNPGRKSFRPTVEALEKRELLDTALNQMFVGQVYRDLLKREAEPGGLAAWTGILDGGVSPTQVVVRIENSPEYRTLVVNRLYGLYLRRAADPFGQAAWVNFLAQGGTNVPLSAQLLGSDEYLNQRGGGNNFGCLQAIYADVLHRSIDSGEAQAWAQALAGGMTRAAICAAILNSYEADKIAVEGWYNQFLHRAAEPDGLNAFISQLQQGVSREPVLAAIVGSAEYIAKVPKPVAATTISGVVQDAAGKPMAGVPIEVGGLQGVTGADGSFTLTVPPAGFTDPFGIPVPKGDPAFDPNGTGTQVIPMNRDRFDPSTGTSASNPLRHPNVITTYIDGSMVYGSDPQRAAALRTFDGTGKLKTSPGNLLPFDNATYFPKGPLNMDNNGPLSATALFAAGDVRANENVGLATLQTLFVREHNFLAGQIKQANPSLSDEDIFQQARKLVAAEIQHINYNEYLPLLLGPNALKPYTGYNPAVDPTPGVLFTTAAFRFAHSETPKTIIRLDANGNPIPGGTLSLLDSSFNTKPIVQGGIDSILRAFAAQPIPRVAPFEIDDARNLLFGPPGAGGIDLVAVDIQRGRDLGLPSYNQARKDFGLKPAASFADITADTAVQGYLQTAYGSVDKIDALVGMVAEDHVPGAMVGPLLFNVIKDQFERLRDGDRYWYENGQFTPSELVQIRNTTLADIIRRNTSVTNLQGNVFTTKTAPAGPDPAGMPALSPQTDYRSFDGTLNNLFQPKLGQTGTQIRLDSTISYGDGISTPNGADRPNPRTISNVIFSHVEPTPDPSGANVFHFFWGQFITHDIDLTPAGLPDTIKAHGEALSGSTAFSLYGKKLSTLLGHAVQPSMNNVISQPIVLAVKSSGS